MTDIITPAKIRRGFAAMSPEKRRAIASKGGRSVNPANRAFSRDPALAERTGRKGGAVTLVDRVARKLEQETREIAAMIGDGAYVSVTLTVDADGPRWGAIASRFSLDGTCRNVGTAYRQSGPCATLSVLRAAVESALAKEG